MTDDLSQLKIDQSAKTFTRRKRKKVIYIAVGAVLVLLIGAVGYAGGREASVLDMSIPFAAGGLYSTAEDLLRWDRGLEAGLS